MQELSESTVDFSQIQSESCPRAGFGDERSNEEMTMEMERPKGRETYMDMVVDWSLAHEVESTRHAIIKRARSLAERLERLATGLELDGDYSLNSIGELQGNGVELDTWCHKYAFARDTLKMLRHAMDEDAKGTN